MDESVNDHVIRRSRLSSVTNADEHVDSSHDSSTHTPLRRRNTLRNSYKLFFDSDDEHMSEDDLPPPRRRRNKIIKSVSPFSHPDSTSSDNNDIAPPHKVSHPAELIVPENEDPLVVTGQTILNHRSNVLRKLPYMDGLVRARAIKAEISNNISLLQPLDQLTNKRPQLDDDPDNKLIKTLRDDQKLKWANIVQILNEQHRKRGEAANFTEPSVYSRYIRCTAEVASPVCEIGFNARDYMHLRHTNGDPTMVSTVGKKRVKNYENAKELESNMRMRTKGEGGDGLAGLETAEVSEQLMEAVAKVERSFWILVADEMERATTKFYQPEELASRYHAI